LENCARLDDGCHDSPPTTRCRQRDDAPRLKGVHGSEKRAWLAIRTPHGRLTRYTRTWHTGFRADRRQSGEWPRGSASQHALSGSRVFRPEQADPRDDDTPKCPRELAVAALKSYVCDCSGKSMHGLSCLLPNGFRRVQLDSWNHR
jgi:hypothetical protein